MSNQTSDDFEKEYEEYKREQAWAPIHPKALSSSVRMFLILALISIICAIGSSLFWTGCAKLVIHLIKGE